jgi:transposase
MVWGCFAGAELGKLVAYPKGGITAADYINMMEESLLPFILQLNYNNTLIGPDTIEVGTMGQYIYMHDNAPIHRAASTEAFLQQHHITTMWWPANSPDLNPIEHLWHQLKVKFHEEYFTARHDTISRSENALQQYMEGLLWTWRTKLGDLPRRLVESMPNRVNAVLRARGGHTHY